MHDTQHITTLLVDVLKGDGDALPILADLLEEAGDIDKSNQARSVADSMDALKLAMQMMPYRVSVHLACDCAERVFRSRASRRLDDAAPFETVRQWLTGKVSDTELNRACRVLSNKRLLDEFVVVASDEQADCADKLAAATRSTFLVVHHERHYGADAKNGQALEYANAAREEAATVAILARIAANLPMEPRRWFRKRPAQTTSGLQELAWQTKHAVAMLKALEAVEP